MFLLVLFLQREIEKKKKTQIGNNDYEDKNPKNTKTSRKDFSSL